MDDLISNTVGEILKGQDKNPSKEDPVILIDAVKLIKEMYEDGAFPLEMADVLMERICNQPTAYNVDKVVEENKQMKEVIYKASEELQKIIDYPHGIISCVQFFPKLREIQDELVGILEDRQVE